MRLCVPCHSHIMKVRHNQCLVCKVSFWVSCEPFDVFQHLLSRRLERPRFALFVHERRLVVGVVATSEFHRLYAIFDGKFKFFSFHNTFVYLMFTKSINSMPLEPTLTFALLCRRAYNQGHQSSIRLGLHTDAYRSSHVG